MAKKARLPQFFTWVLPPPEQATGSFDRGAITEQKMIGFAGEGSLIHRVGPLYYWAWAKALHPSAVEPHPHRGFEIMSYVLEGTIEHRDTLGHQSRIGAGGLQLMQTGSGME
ncbi:MAG TPA: pirin family protein, partial [Oligoflexus sp.]|uniref:pirin family protein n=1 Tax=Oligoflexus sp. TaxID=1971216 RepID=UPI002D3D9B76